MNEAKIFFNDLSKLNRYLSAGYFLGHPNKRIFKDAQRKIKINKNDIILDIGAGSGLIDKYIIPICKEITLCDVADKLINDAMVKFRKHKNINYVVADFNQQLPFVDNQFDKIICQGVMQYADNYYELVEQLLRILKPNGLIFISPVSLSVKVRDNSFFYKLLVYKNIFLKKIITWIYRRKNITEVRPNSRHLDKDEIIEILNKINYIDYKFEKIDSKIFYSKVKESLTIKKIK